MDVEDTSYSNPAPAEPAAEAPQPEPAPAEPVPHLEIDERTGKRSVVIKAPESPQTAETKPQVQNVPQAEEKPNEAQNSEPEAKPNLDLINKVTGAPKPFYKPDELMLNMQLGTVDVERVPPEIRQRYQALNQQKQPTQAEAEKAVREQIQKMAKSEAMKKSGITEDELQLGEFSDDPEVEKKIRDYRTAYELAQQTIIRDSLDRYRKIQAAENSRREVMNNVKKFIEDQRAVEPHFDEIGKLMETKFQEMPYQKAVAIAPVLQAAINHNLTQEQANVLGEYYNICRKEIYAKINKTSVTPQPIIPKVEGRGAGLSTGESKDYASLLRNASLRNKPSILAEWIKSAKEK